MRRVEEELPDVEIRSDDEKDAVATESGIAAASVPEEPYGSDTVPTQIPAGL